MTPKEALENVEHEIQQRLNDMVVDGCDLGSVLTLESCLRMNFQIVREALERAKKEHELLELYQKQFSYFNFDEDKGLRKIKQKEKELEEF